jgi:mono/diheme cytochrome c family protein
MRIAFFALTVAIALPLGAQDRSPRKLIPEMDGKSLFQAYCASCHGMDGKGKGPVAAAMKEKVPDLTTLSFRRGGKFPAAELEKMILGEGDPRAAHGNREMPVWGPLFRQVQNDRDLGLVRVRSVVDYIAQWQKPKP